MTRGKSSCEEISGKSRRKRAARRQLEFKSDGGMNLTSSLPPELTTAHRKDALLRFNSLTIEDQIAIKLAGKKKADDGDSVSSDSSTDSDYEDKNIDDQSGKPSSNSVNDFALGAGPFADQIKSEDITDVNKGKKQAMDVYDERLSKTEADFNLALNSMREAKTWACAKCTYVNKISSHSCEMCDEPKSKGHTTEKPTLPGAYSVAKTKTRSVTWQCKSCTYKENKIGSVKCSICDVPRDGAVVSRVSGVPSTPGAFSVCPDTPAADVTISEWECTTCTFKHNKITSVVCEVCQAAPMNGAVEVPFKPEWECKTCTFTHNKITSSVCE
eukprot:scaffold253460_cov83-Cyclotella_meneghiniana.AAC.1